MIWKRVCKKITWRISQIYPAKEIEAQLMSWARIKEEKKGEYNVRYTKGGWCQYAGIIVEWNSLGITRNWRWLSNGILSKVMLIYLRRNLKKVLENSLNRNSSAWKTLIGTRNIRWDSVSMAYTWEGLSMLKHLKNMGGANEDDDLVVDRYCTQRSMHCTWWVWDEGYWCFFWRRPREFRFEIRDGKRKGKVGLRPST